MSQAYQNQLAAAMNQQSAQAMFNQLASQQQQAMFPGALTPNYEEPKPNHDDLPFDTVWGEIIGWRAWEFTDGKLVSPYRKTTWDAGEIIEASETPVNTTAGIYAHKKCEQVFEQESGWMVVGTVYLWGDIVEHENGYRAEFARVHELHFFNSKATDGFKSWLKSEFGDAVVNSGAA